MEKKELIQAVSSELAFIVPGQMPYDEFLEVLAEYINKLVREDFDKLIRLLYRMDVSEEKLKYLLKENQGEDAGPIIGALIIEREEQKIKTREQFRQKDSNIGEDEKW